MPVQASTGFNINGELTATTFMARDFGNPFNGLFQASNSYDTGAIRVYVENATITINYHGTPFTFTLRSFLQNIIFPRWALFVNFILVDSKEDADIVVRVFPAPEHGFGAGAAAAAYPLGYPTEPGTSAYQGAIELHPEQIEQTLNSLNSVDLGFIHHESDLDLVRAILVYVLTHELGHTLGFEHSARAASGCDVEASLTTQAPLMTGNMMDYFRIQYHLNGGTPVFIDQIMPSEKELRAYFNVNGYGNFDKDINPICGPARATKQRFLATILELMG